MLNYKNQTHFHPFPHQGTITLYILSVNYVVLNPLTNFNIFWLLNIQNQFILPQYIFSYLNEARQDPDSGSGTLPFEVKALPAVPREIQMLWHETNTRIT